MAREHNHGEHCAMAMVAFLQPAVDQLVGLATLNQVLPEHAMQPGSARSVALTAQWIQGILDGYQNLHGEVEVASYVHASEAFMKAVR